MPEADPPPTTADELVAELRRLVRAAYTLGRNVGRPNHERALATLRARLRRLEERIRQAADRSPEGSGDEGPGGG